VKNFATTLLLMILTSPLFAVTGPTVTLQTTTVSNPYPNSFTVNATFSENVMGLGPSAVNVTNGTVVSITGNECQLNYVLVIQPTATGVVTVSIPANVVTSVSTGAPNQASNVLTISGLNPVLHPASNFNLKTWSLTLPLPLGAMDNAISIGQTTLNGTPGLNNGYTNAPYFFTDPVTGAMDFFAPIYGGTTPNSDFSRCELLEVLPGATPTWKLSTFSSNTLAASLLVSEVGPVSKQVIIGQIHDKGNTDSLGHTASNSPFVKLYYNMSALDPNHNVCNGCVYAQVRATPAQGNFLKIVSLLHDIPLNTIFTYNINLLSTGALTITANNVSTVINVSTSTNNTIGWGSEELYFKAGVYNLEAGTSPTLGAAASFYSLLVTHT